MRSKLLVKYTAITKEMPVFVFFYCSLGFPFLYVCVCQPVCWLFSWDLSGLRLNGRLHDCHLELVGPTMERRRFTGSALYLPSSSTLILLIVLSSVGSDFLTKIILDSQQRNGNFKPISKQASNMRQYYSITTLSLNKVPEVKFFEG